MKDKHFVLILLFLLVVSVGFVVKYKSLSDSYAERLDFFNEELSLIQNPEIIYEGLDEREIRNVEAILNVTRIELLSFQRSIKFVANISGYTNGAAINIERGDIIINYEYCIFNDDGERECEEWESGFRRSLCHELLHTFLDHPYEEMIVHNLDNHLVLCYEDVESSEQYPSQFKQATDKGEKKNIKKEAKQ